MDMAVRRRTRSGDPLVVALASLVVLTAFVGLRWNYAADRNTGAFVMAGTRSVDPVSPPTGIPVQQGAGYDGQFFWRIAVDPLSLDEKTAHGITLDIPLRSQRIGYPLLGWLLSMGQEHLVANALILINIGSLTLLAAMGAIEARRVGRNGWYGLVLGVLPAFVFSLSRTLSEPLATALLVAGVIAVRRRRFGLAALAFTAAVLTREQACMVVAAYGIFRLIDVARRRSPFGFADVTWALPGVVFVSWQLLLWGLLDVVPLLDSGDANLAIPLSDLLPALPDWATTSPAVELTHVAGLPVPIVYDPIRALLLLPVLVVLAVSALLAKLPSESQWEKLAIGALGLLGLSLSTSVWTGPADFRTMVDLLALSWLVVLVAGRERLLQTTGAALGAVAALSALAFVFVL